jgi:HK97 family phage portal protein
MGLRSRLAARLDPERAAPPLSIDGYMALLQYAGNTYAAGQQSLAGGPPKEVSQSFQGYVQGVYKANGVVYACISARMHYFSQVRFQFRQMRNGRPGDLFGTQELQILERPWPNGTTSDLLSRAELDVSLEGNFYAYRDRDVLRRMRPDWVSIALSAPPDDRDAEILGYGYHPGGYNSGKPPLAMLPEEVLHYAPSPDPQARYRGMSWLTSVMNEIQADDAATTHKGKFFQNGATANTVATLDPSIGKEAFNAWVEAFKRGHEGVENAYKTLYLGGGADVKVIGSNMQQVTFKEVQGAGETRIAAASGVPPVLIGLSEGLQAASYSNYHQAARSYGDGSLRYWWGSFATSAATILTVPGGADLWYDDRSVPFLQEDQTDLAVVEQTKAGTMRTLIDAGFTPQSVIEAVNNSDLTMLDHSELFSVQLQPIPTPKVYLDGVMAGIQAQDAQTAKTLIDSGFTPDSVIKAIQTQDFQALVGVEQVQLAPIAQVTEGKGSLVSGTVVPAGASGTETVPAVTGKNSVRALLEPYLPPRGDEDG